VGIQQRKKRQREQLRQEILDVAGELFAEGGYDNVSMRKIAERIEYSPTTIYLYFKDKDELLGQICENTFARLLAKIQDATKKHNDPVESLRIGCRAYIDFGISHPHAYRMTFADPYFASAHNSGMTMEEFKDSMGGRAFMFLERGIQRCIEAGRLRDVNVRETATAWWAMMHGVTMLLITKGKVPWVGAERLIDQSLDLLIQGITV
jgi:AcrR family transcriptional regulator